MKKIFAISALAVILAACEIEETSTATMSISASTRETPAGTKTSLDGNDTDGFDVVWNEGDCIVIDGKTFTLAEGAGTTDGKFDGPQLADGRYDAFYGTTDGNMPLTQHYTAGSIANSPMSARVTVTDGQAAPVQFINMGGLLRLKISKVKAAEVKGITVSGRLSNSDMRLYLDCGDGVEISEEGTVFFIAMTSGTYTNVSVEMNLVGGGTMTRTLPIGKNLVIKNAEITPASFRTNTLNGHEFVDLGLDSGLFWATCNIGADSPDEVGHYYAWGETSLQDGFSFSWNGYKYGTSEKSLTKYCQSETYGSVDNKTTLEPGDDVANVKWKNGWRMPTAEDYQELIDKCYWEWVSTGSSIYETQGWIIYKAKDDDHKGKMCDVNGTGRIEGYSKSDTHIFLPVSGRFYDNKDQEYPSDCYYWTSSLHTGYSYSGQNLAASSLSRHIGHYYRAAGEPVRAVCE